MSNTLIGYRIAVCSVLPIILLSLFSLYRRQAYSVFDVSNCMPRAFPIWACYQKPVWRVTSRSGTYDSKVVCVGIHKSHTVIAWCVSILISYSGNV